MLMAVSERDGRVMSNMDAESREVHVRLEAWGRWAHDGIRPFPEWTPFGKAVKHGPHWASVSHQGREEIMPDAIAAVDAAVSRLCEIDKRAIKAYYTHQEPPEVGATRCHMKLRMFQNVLRRARWRVKIYLSDAHIISPAHRIV